MNSLISKGFFVAYFDFSGFEISINRYIQSLKRALDDIKSDYFCDIEPDIFKPLYDNFAKHGDYYLNIADFKSYNEAQERISKDFSFRVDWTIKSLVNISRTAKFSSDRTVKEYADDTWGIKPAQ